MTPEQVINFFGPWAPVLVALAAGAWTVRLMVKDVYPGLKAVTVIAENVQGIPAIKVEVDEIKVKVDSTGSSVAKISDTVKDIPALQKRLKTLEEEVAEIKSQMNELVSSGLIPRKEGVSISVN